jgi:HEAT repeat protein
MGRSRRFVVLVVLLAAGCGQGSTASLIQQLKAPDPGARLKAVRILPERQKDAAQVIPALIEALKDEDEAVRRGAAFGLGTFGEQARDAVPALLECLRDRESGVRKAAGVSLKQIDPAAAVKAGVR